MNQAIQTQDFRFYGAIYFYIAGDELIGHAEFPIQLGEAQEEDQQENKIRAASRSISHLARRRRNLRRRRLAYT